MDSHQERQSLEQVSLEIYQRLVDSVRDATSPQAAVEGFVESVYVKATDGQIVISNQAYDTTFAGSVAAVGRNAKTYLDKSIWHVANASDELIIHGCSHVEFGHVGQTSAGETVAMLTYKRSLLGIGHPKMAVLGVTRIREVVDDGLANRIQSLAASWRQFEKLDARDQQIAKGIALGHKVKTLAKELEVSEKTVENRRQVVYRALSINGPTELVRILVRLQDNGFSDFGL